ncbi:hypothetical protein TrCOL_g8361 [Triparma columacea]|uniref:AAA+ ATPase domain-containing protein n=1 Tax=Triparma columacea TaxID=722753 RepID=A0A9W7FX39_9STRA|nr:hypothetical protein TrCOL_g8361 [Triparma columacea]
MSFYLNSGTSSGRSNSSNGRSQVTIGQKIVQATVEIGLSVVISAGLLYAFKTLSGSSLSSFLDPIGLKPEKGRKGAEGRLHSILTARAEKKNPSSPAKIPPLDLNSYELVIAESVLDPSTISTPFSSIGGISSLKTQVYELCVLPLLRPDIFRAANVEVTKGVLLYGRPGTGKTMIAKAIASEGSALFINVKLSVIMNKYFGESNKMVSSVFSLARKLSPSLIFIDEIDTFLKQRDDSAEALGSMKSEFLTMWDGVNQGNGGEEEGIVMVMGATNRPYDVDQAILRRLPRQFEIPLPSRSGRLDILTKMLSNDSLDPSALAYLGTVADETEGFSGSDLREVVRCAKMERVTEITGDFSRRRCEGKDDGGEDKLGGRGEGNMRKVGRGDFVKALSKCSRTGEKARDYRDKDELRDGRAGKKDVDVTDVMKIMAMMMQQNGGRRNGGGTGKDGWE